MASGIGGGSADAGAALRLLTSPVADRPEACARGRAGAGQRRSGLPAQPADARGGGGRSACACRSDRFQRDAGADRQSAGAALDRGGVRALGRRRSRCARRLASGAQRPAGTGASRWCRRSRRCSTGSANCEGATFVPHVGHRGDLLRLVRRRRPPAISPPPAFPRIGGISRPTCARGAGMSEARPILTAAAMRAAEEAAIDGGTSVEALMERAGEALAEAVYRFAGPMPVLVLAGPGNNGGDGRVAARHPRGAGCRGTRRGAERTVGIDRAGVSAGRCLVRNGPQARAGT